MDFQKEFADFLADYDIDVYDSADLGHDDFRFDCVIVNVHINEFKARVRAKKAVTDANNIWEDCQITMKSFKANSVSDDEFDFSMVVNFIDESIKAEIGDEIVKTPGYESSHTEEVWGTMVNVPEGEPDTYDVYSDISGKLIDWEDGTDPAWYHEKTDKIYNSREALEFYMKDKDSVVINEGTDDEETITKEEMEDFDALDCAEIVERISDFKQITRENIEDLIK